MSNPSRVAFLLPVILAPSDADPGMLNVKCRTDDKVAGVDSDFVCETTRPVGRGEELLTQYMQDPRGRSNTRFLIDYGFVPEENPDNSALIRLARFQDIPRAKVEALFFHRLTERLPFP